MFQNTKPKARVKYDQPIQNDPAFCDAQMSRSAPRGSEVTASSWTQCLQIRPEENGAAQWCSGGAGGLRRSRCCLGPKRMREDHVQSCVGDGGKTGVLASSLSHACSPGKSSRAKAYSSHQKCGAGGLARRFRTRPAPTEDPTRFPVPCQEAPNQWSLLFQGT